MVTQSDKTAKIPYPHLESWMHKRIPLPCETWDERLARYKTQEPILQALLPVLFRILKSSSLLHPGRRWAIYRIVTKFMALYYRIVRGMEIHGIENIPKQGAIFYINHMAGIDVVIPFMAAFRKPLGIFTDMGDNFLVDIMEIFGTVPRRGTAPLMVEKMIRNLLLRNRYFVMWPEGTPDKGEGVMQGFSGIVKVYATVNADRDRIPFVPVVMQGLDRSGKQYTPDFRKLFTNWKNLTKIQRQKVLRKVKRAGVKKVIFTYLKPVYIPRDWLKPPEEGGKTPRELIDWLMLKIAKKLGQKTLAPNPALNNRKTDRTPWHG
jgi:1-acyl-sn-glycerol-3-phosphate acyltransferase